MSDHLRSFDKNVKNCLICQFWQLHKYIFVCSAYIYTCTSIWQTRILWQFSKWRMNQVLPYVVCSLSDTWPILVWWRACNLHVHLKGLTKWKPNFLFFFSFFVRVNNKSLRISCNFKQSTTKNYYSFTAEIYKRIIWAATRFSNLDRAVCFISFLRSLRQRFEHVSHSVYDRNWIEDVELKFISILILKLNFIYSSVVNACFFYWVVFY